MLPLVSLVLNENFNVIDAGWGLKTLAPIMLVPISALRWRYNAPRIS